MSKQAKILIIILAVILLAVLYLLLTSESVKNNDKVDTLNQPAEIKTTAMSDEKYMSDSQTIFSAFTEAMAANSLTAEQIDELRSRLLAIEGIPAKYRDPHVKLVQVFDKMENYLATKDEKEKTQIIKELNQLKADYSWFNN